MAVLNRGVPGYSAAEHVIQTAFYERTHGVSPRCSIYYTGWNDLHVDIAPQDFTSDDFIDHDHFVPAGLLKFAARLAPAVAAACR